MELDFGVLAQANLGKKVAVEAIYTVFNTGFPLPTACLEFNREEMALAAVTPKMNGKAIGAGSSDTGAAGKGIRNPVRGLSGMVGRLDVVVGMLLAVAVWFVGF